MSLGVVGRESTLEELGAGSLISSRRVIPQYGPLVISPHTQPPPQHLPHRDTLSHGWKENRGVPKVT